VHHELLRSITNAALALFEAEACSLALLDREREELVFYATSGGRADQVDGMHLPVGHGIAGWVVASGEAIAVQDVARDPRFAADVASSLGHTPRSIVAMPLETERGILGVIEVLDARSEDRSNMELLELFARQAALAIESTAVVSDLGRSLFEAAAGATGDAELTALLREVARTAPAPRGELARVAALFWELGLAGSDEAALAVRIIEAFLDYARGRPA
jgi:signal transduction protein with GAF and PtsI domain